MQRINHIDSTIIEAYTGTAILLDPGDIVRIVDIDGQQIADTWAVSLENQSEFLCAGNTRAANQRLFPAPGDLFFSNHMRPMLQFVRDTSAGSHDMLIPACSSDMYKSAFDDAEHPSCAGNFRKACASMQLSPTHIPQPVNFFQNSSADGDGEIRINPSNTKPGDLVELRAEMTLALIVTSCSFDLGDPGSPLRMNGERCTPIRLDRIHP
ncbi:DUF1989 domain-containing protein [Nocardia brasiliensis]